METKGDRRRQRPCSASAPWAFPLFFNLPDLPLKFELRMEPSAGNAPATLRYEGSAQLLPEGTRNCLINLRACEGLVSMGCFFLPTHYHALTRITTSGRASRDRREVEARVSVSNHSCELVFIRGKKKGLDG